MVRREDGGDGFSLRAERHAEPKLLLSIVEALRDDPDRLSPPGSLQPRPVSRTLYPSRNVVECSIAIVTTRITEVLVNVRVVRFRPSSVHRDRIRINHEDIGTIQTVLDEVVVLAIEHERDRVIPVYRVDLLVGQLSRVQIVIRSIRFITGVPIEDIGSIPEVFHLVVYRGEIEEGVPHVVLYVEA